MKIKPFGVEMWMNEFETTCELNLAETCVESLTIAQLMALSDKDETGLAELLPMKMTYGAIEGSDRLRDAICTLYEHQARNNILVTHGAIGANSLVHQTLLSHGDPVISLVPCYQQHYSIPESIGAEVQLRLERTDLFDRQLPRRQAWPSGECRCGELLVRPGRTQAHSGGRRWRIWSRCGLG